MAGFVVASQSPPSSSPPDRHSKDIPTPLSLDTRPPSSPFPSPSSSFLPPPMPGAHEFANKPLTNRFVRHKKSGSPSHPPESPVTKKGDAQTIESSKPINGIMANLDTDLRPASSAALTPSTPTPASLVMTPKQSTSPSSGFALATESTAGCDTPTPIQITLPPPPSSPTQIFAAAAPTLIRTPSGSGSASKHTSLSSSRPAPASPAPSRRQSGVPSVRSRHRSGLSTASTSSSKLGTIKSPPVVLPPAKRRGEIKVRDFAYPAVDARHIGRGPDTPKVIKRLLKQHGPMTSAGSRRASGMSESSIDSEDGGSRRSSGFGGWGAFRWASKLRNEWGFGSGSGNRGSASGGYTPSQLDFERNFDGGGEPELTLSPADADDGEFLSDEYDEDDGESEELFPGIYQALYDFDPEGTAEMGLKEGQTVRVVGRGGGVGWAIVVRPDAEGEVEGGDSNWALVPESYLKVVSLDETNPEGDGRLSLDDTGEARQQAG